MRVIITGAGGNLGGKLIEHLQAADWCSSIIGIDPRPLTSQGKFRAIEADLRDARDSRWIEPVESADAVVHFAAQNTAPDSNWTEAALSSDMTLNLLEHVGHAPCRFVFASSNHVMGGYKDAPLAAGDKLSTATPPRPGTRFFDGNVFQHPSAYGSSKLYGERAVIARVLGSGGQMSGVNIRIGWVQPGENIPASIGPHGGGRRVGNIETDADELARALPWYRGMWLSNRDFLQLMERALTTSAADWPAPAITVCGVSNNTGTMWNLAEGRDLLGYAPQDDVTR